MDLRVEGELDEVPAGVALAGYRIMQEALTNTLRHAAAETATVTLTVRSGSLTIEVVDDGRGTDPGGPDVSTGGHGLVGTRVLILTTFDLDEYVFAALRAGASGFLLKDTLPHDLLAAVRIVAAGDALLAPSVTRRLMEEFARRQPVSTGSASDALETLTAREHEVLAAVARGLTNAEIAETLFMSLATAKTHVSRVLSKLGARDRAQLVVVAYENGVVTPGVS